MELKWKINIVPNLLEIFILTYLLSYFIKYFMMKLIYIYFVSTRNICTVQLLTRLLFSEIYTRGVLSFQNIFPNIAIRA